MSQRTGGWRRLAPLVALLVLGACERGGETAGTAAAPPAAPPVPAVAPRREPLVGGPHPALFLAVAQFVDVKKPDGKTQPVPGPAKLMIVRRTGAAWTTTILEDPDSNAFHKAIPWEDGLITIGATQAMLKTWRYADGAWSATTRWNPRFGGKFDRLRDIERADVDGDGKDDLVIATHDQGVVAIVHPSDGWRVEEIDRQPDTFVHEIEIGDIDGDGAPEIFATPSKPNKLDQEQPGEVAMYRRTPAGTWQRSIVDAPGDTHAKEILVADMDRDAQCELYVVWEGAVGAGGQIVRPVTVKQYRFKDGAFTSTVVATVPDRQMRAIQAGDVNGDGKMDLVAGALASGLWLFEQGPEGADGAWTRTLIDAKSSGFEQPVDLADLDGDGRLEIYVASEDQHELRQYRWQDGAFVKTVLAPLVPGDIVWNVTHGAL
ncbi:MAG: VCBS repeat-containing protein [Myxococcales bacterium]|jgi:hypothetical protein|nr:VCBS repeat-containing protein [Myxococcales bacterium]